MKFKTLLLVLLSLIFGYGMLGNVNADTDSLKFFGDLRIRYEGIYDRNIADQGRGMLRLRLGVKKKIEKQVELIEGISTDSGPTSTNVPFTASFNRKSWALDQAYIVYRPNWASYLTLIAGKMKNPLYHTQILWDSDVTPEGLAEQVYFKDVL